MAPRHQHGLPTQATAQLEEGHDRTGKGHGADQDADRDLELVGDAARSRLSAVELGHDPDQDGRQSDEAVQDRDQLRHLRHGHARGQHRTHDAAQRDRPRQKGGGRRRGFRHGAAARHEDRHQRDRHGQNHARRSEQVAAA
jgi:hypothetical protein